MPLTQGKKILIPSFALGRAQEVILLIRSGINRGLIPRVPVYVDGMVRDICRTYRLHPGNLKKRLVKAILKGNDPFYSDEVQPVPTLADRSELVNNPGLAVFVASSGMLIGGPSVQYEEKIISREDGLVIITGYQDEEAPGRALLNLAEVVETPQMEDSDSEKQPPTFSLSGKSLPVRADVCQVGLSAHGDQEEILSLVTKLSPRDLFLVHGDANTMPSLARLVTGDYLRGVYTPVCGDVMDIAYRTLRKQLTRNWPWTMDEEAFPDDDGQRKLNLYLREHYPEREWTALQQAHIWYGKAIADPEEITVWQQMLLDSVCFVSNVMRLFLFHPATEEELAVALEPKVINLQMIKDRANELFGFLKFKKAGIHPEERKVLLHFLFPDAVDMKAFEAAADKFEAETEWTVSIHPGTNHVSAQQLLHVLFDGSVSRVRYYETERIYQVTLTDKQPGDTSLCEQFQKETGWMLCLLSDGAQGSGTAAATKPKPSFNPDRNGEPMEQNTAFSYIRNVCAEDGIPLQKFGIKNNGQGKYIELTFLSPELCARYADLINALSDDIGWPLTISNTVLQNQVLPIAAHVAEQAGLGLKKSPSYMPMSQEIQLKVAGFSQDIGEAVVSEITEKTGLSCRLITA